MHQNQFNMEQNQDTSLFGINVDQAGKSHLADTAKWAKFLAVFGFIICGLIVIIGIFFGSFFSMLTSQYGGDNPFNDMGGLPALVPLWVLPWPWYIFLWRLSIFSLAFTFFVLLPK